MTWQIEGHERTVHALTRDVNTSRIAHAYLFVGPPRIGKTTLAIKLAQVLNCQGSEPPCGTCSPCAKIARGTHPDVQFIASAGDRVQHAPGQVQTEEPRARKRVRQDLIPIDDVRTMQRSVALAPMEGRWKVVIIAGAERMTVEAANALLKTLEEPPAHVALVLTTTDAGLLLPTIVSRCRVMPLSRLSRTQVETALRERWAVEPAHARFLAALAGGRLGWAVMALQDQTILSEREENLQILAQALDAGQAGRLTMAGELAQGFTQHRTRVLDMLQVWLSWARDLWLVSLGCPEQMIVNVDQAPILHARAQRVGAQAAQSLTLALRNAQQQLDQNVNPRLALEVLLLGLPR